MLRILLPPTCMVIALATGPGTSVGAEKSATRVLFSERFEDADLAARGWYDGRRFRIAGDARGGQGCVEYEWTEGQPKVQGSSAVRHLFEPTEEVSLRFYLIGIGIRDLTPELLQAAGAGQQYTRPAVYRKQQPFVLFTDLRLHLDRRHDLNRFRENELLLIVPELIPGRFSVFQIADTDSHFKKRHTG